MREAPEVRFFKSGPGTATAIAIGAAAVAGALVWMRRAKGQERREREAVVIAATGTSVLAWGFDALAERQGWIRGGFFELPITTQVAMSVPWSVGFMTAWLAGYRWLTAGSRRPYAIYGAVAAGFAPLSLTAGAWEMNRGYFQLGNGWKLGYNAAVAVPLMMAPLAMYEGLKWRLPLRTERPEAVESRACGMPTEPMQAFSSV
ncbi:MAG: hypothetical protein ACK46X_10785 [Candidatus Sericytochromatia bacterium]